MSEKENPRTLEQIEKEIADVKKELENVHGTETEVYARIVGYYRAIKNWNKGKRDEYEIRKTFNLDVQGERKAESKAASENMSLSEKDSSLNIASSKNEVRQEAASNEKDTSGYSYELFAKKTCPNCPPVKEYMKNIPLEGKYIDVDTDEGLSEAASKGVFASPTVIVYDSEGTEIERGHNVEELELIFDKVLVKEPCVSC